MQIFIDFVVERCKKAWVTKKLHNKEGLIPVHSGGKEETDRMFYWPSRILQSVIKPLNDHSPELRALQIQN